MESQADVERELHSLRTKLEKLLAIPQDGPTAAFYQREINAALVESAREGE